MFKWRGQRFEKSKQEAKQQLGQPLGEREQKTKKRPDQPLEKREQKTRQLEEREISVSPMFKWLTKQSAKKARKAKLLWEREFNIVKEGLDEEQVVGFVNDLMAQYSVSLDSLLDTRVIDAEQMAAGIKLKAQTEAEAEAVRIISQAKQEAEEIKRKAEIATRKEAEDIISVANRKAEITEVEAKQKALLFLLRAREEIEEGIKAEYKRAHSRLFSSLQDLMSVGQNIEAELKSKRARLWESKDFELKESETPLLRTSGMVTPSPKTSAPTEIEIEPDIVSEEKTEEPAQLQKETPEEKIERPVQFQKETPEQKIEQPARLQEETPEEKIEQPAQFQEEALEEKIEEPVQLQEEVTVSEPPEATTEKHLPEERPGMGETESAQLKLDSQAPYAGEVELIIASPVELKLVSRLYNYLQTIPELRILYTRGSWDQGTTITVVSDKPLPLISLISQTPGVEVSPELLEIESPATGKSGSLLRGEKRGAKRIKLILKEEPPR